VTTALPVRATKHARVAKPPTTTKAILEARKRRDELLAILTLRGAPVDRAKMSLQDRRSFAKTPYAKAAEKYLAGHDDFAWRQAHRVAARHIPVEDLYQAAQIGLVKALDKFDRKLVETGKVTSFLTYARWWVRCELGRVLDEEALIHVPMGAKRVATDIRRVVDAADNDIPDEEVATLLQIDEDKVRTHRDVYLGHEHSSLDERRPNRRNETSRRVLAAIRDMDDASTSHSAEVGLLGELAAAVKKLSPLQRRLVCELTGLEIDDEAAACVMPASETAREALLKAALGRVRCAVT
jgi:RNA polymerase sigma factor (sigma-70 family)